MNLAVLSVCLLLQLASSLHGLPRPSGADLETAAAPKYYITVAVGADLPEPRDGGSTGDQRYYISIIVPARSPQTARPLVAEAFEPRTPQFAAIRVNCPEGRAPCGGGCCVAVNSDSSTGPDGPISFD